MKKASLFLAFATASLFASDPICDSDDIKSMVNSLNSKSPMRVDVVTTLMTTTCANGKLMYFYTLNDDVDIKWDKFTLEQIEHFRKGQSAMLKNQYCTNIDLISLREAVSGLVWIYKTPSGKNIARIEASNDDCKK